jgi:outer membrane protein
MHIAHLLPALMLALLAGGCLDQSGSSPSVAVVDSSRVFKESGPGKAGIKHLETLHESMQEELNSLQQELQKKPDDETLQQKLQEKYLVYQQRIGAEQQQVISVLNEAIQKALDACRSRRNLSLILGTDAVLSYGPAADITDTVIAEVNKSDVSFKPIEPDQSGANAPAEPAPEKNDAPPPAEKK